MPEPISVITLITVIITGITQGIQLFLDYRLAQHQGNANAYRVYESECFSNWNCCGGAPEDPEDPG